MPISVTASDLNGHNFNPLLQLAFHGNLNYKLQNCKNYEAFHTKVTEAFTGVEVRKSYYIN